MRFDRQFSIGVLLAGMTLGTAGLARGEDKPAADSARPAAQDGARGPEGRAGGRMDPAKMLERFQDLTKDLNLSDEQKTKIKDIIAKAKPDLEAAVKDSEKLEGRERFQKIREVMAPVREKMMDVLDETQREKLREKMQNAGGRGGPDGGPRERDGNKPPQGDRPARPEGARRPGGPGGAGGPPPEGPGVMIGRLRDNLDKLDLKDDQKKKVDALLSETETKLRDAMKENRTKLEEILTDDQKAKLKEMMPPRRPEGEGKDGGKGPKGEKRPPEKQ